ncbi:MAG TPA: DNA polymerase III subunit gamma/tau, partial [Candidatus Saccharimonadales bacterium]|nr:DNA polymerase III subunit gamma/tau [Candidatus Saccharimonadales bacterium]
MGQALYRTHRPTRLRDVVGQEHITTALTRALKKGTISHAYLFTGPKGVGKTSIARILAHEINGLPYEDDRTHLDIIEIDAASNRRIDEIRDLRDKVHIAPTSATYKVYIIDEVHMLTKEAFNALLKTLEEPPAHVVFILATTEVHKLPETIISRTQRFAFKAVEQAKVVAHLRDIATAEHIDITDEALELIARHGEGSFRDSISLLDQIRNSGEKITLADVQACLGLAPEEFIAQIVTALEAHDAASLAGSFSHGYEPAQVARQLGAVLRERLLAGTPVGSKDATIALLQKLVDVPSSPNPRAYLEIALLDAGLEIASESLAGTAP